MNEQTALQTSAPLFRVWLCGPFQVERQAGTTYELLPLKAWGGSNDPRRLLKRLLCSSQRRVRRGELQEALWAEVAPDISRRYLSDAVYRLRVALSPTKDARSLLSVAENHSSLALPEQEVLWVDVDAALALLKQAEVVQARGGDPFALVQEAARFYERGQFLEEEEDLWVQGRRATVERVQHGCFLWLARLYQQRGALNKAETVLNTLMEQDAMDEDALCLLMMNLHLQQRTSQALRLFEQTSHLLEENGLEVAATTKEVANRIHTTLPLHKPPELYQRVGEVLPETQTELDFRTKDAVEIAVTPPYLIPFDMVVADCATWFGYRQAHILAWVDTVLGRGIPIVEFQNRLDQELKMFDEAKFLYRSDEYLLSRRQALVALALLPLARLSKTQQGHWQEAFFVHCATSLTACWHLMQGKEFAIIEEMLSAYIPFLVSQVQQSSSYRLPAASLASQAYRLKGIVTLHQNNLKAREYYCQKAVFYSEIAEDPSLHVAALISLASTYYYSQSPVKAASRYKQALQYQRSVPNLQQSRLYAELAVVAAQEGQTREALRYLEQGQVVYPEHPEHDPSFLYAEFSPASLILEEGLTYLALASRFPADGYEKQAWKTFEQLERLQAQRAIPERIRYEIINHQAETALLLRDQEAFGSYVKQGIEGAKLLNSQQRRQEMVKIYQKARETVWPDEARIAGLAELFL